MNVTLQLRHLEDLRERLRAVHEANLAQLRKEISQTHEHYAKVRETQERPQQNRVDVRA